MVLTIILCILFFAAGCLLGALKAGKGLAESLARERAQREKFFSYMRLYDIWMMAKKYGRPMEEYLLRRGIRRVVIYGMAETGFRLYHELKDTAVEVLYALDGNPRVGLPGLTIYRWGGGGTAPPEEEKRSADAVIVAAVPYFNSIAPELEAAGYRNVIGLDEMLYELI